jgi:hypothetical protein
LDWLPDRVPKSFRRRFRGRTRDAYNHFERPRSPFGVVAIDRWPTLSDRVWSAFEFFNFVVLQRYQSIRRRLVDDAGRVVYAAIGDNWARVAAVTIAPESVPLVDGRKGAQSVVK